MGIDLRDLDTGVEVDIKGRKKADSSEPAYNIAFEVFTTFSATGIGIAGTTILQDLWPHSPMFFMIAILALIIISILTIVLAVVVLLLSGKTIIFSALPVYYSDWNTIELLGAASIGVLFGFLTYRVLHHTKTTSLAKWTTGVAFAITLGALTCLLGAN